MSVGWNALVLIPDRVFGVYEVLSPWILRLAWLLRGGSVRDCAARYTAALHVAEPKVAPPVRCRVKATK